jgi:hypothetical protein
MRINKPDAAGQAALFTAAINDPNQGVLLMVTAAVASPSGRSGTRPLYAIIEAPDARTVQKLIQEGAWNAADGTPYIATFPAGSDVEVGDTFPFNNFTCRLNTAYPQPLGNAILGIRCLVMRTGQGTTYAP